MKVAKVNFNDCIGNDFFFGGITEQFVRYCVEGPSSFDPGMEPTYPEAVELHFFNCPGGEVYEGYAIYSYLRQVAQAGVKVSAFVHGLCASIASVVVLAADERLIGPLGTVMTHKPMVDIGPWANADDHTKAAAELNRVQAQIAAVYTERTGQPLEALHGLMNAETYMSAAEAIANGFATGPLSTSAIEPVEATPQKVLNYAKPKPQAAMATLNDTEKKSLFTEFLNWAGLKPKAEEAATPPVTNTSIEVDGDGGPIYFAEAELAEGAAVYSDEALTVAYADGTYALSDGREVTVAAGLVETLKDAASTDEATNTAELEATNAALLEEIATLKATNALQARTVTGLTNKLATIVPGSTGAPTKTGDAQNITDKTTPEPAVERAAERSVLLRTIK